MSSDRPARWPAGTPIIQEEYWRGQLVTVRPVTVVEDTPALLALFGHAGATFRSGAMRARQQRPLAERLRVYLTAEDLLLTERQNRFHVLTLNPPGTSHAVWLFWDENWTLTTWYVNLQPPFRRLERGVSVGDYLLDIAVTPDLRWSWKDEDEFEAVCAAGVFSAARQAAIRAEGERLIGGIEVRDWPFGSSWPAWRPDAAWPVPTIPPDWQPGGPPDAA